MSEAAAVSYTFRFFISVLAVVGGVVAMTHGHLYIGLGVAAVGIAASVYYGR